MRGPHHPPPTVSSRFVPVKFHARGGLGEVLVALDTELDRHVALKRILGDAGRDPAARHRFLLEAQITGRLEHPGVVPVYGLGLDPQTAQPCYAMRFITGRSLKSALDEFHASAADFDGLAFRKLLACFISVCQTIGYAHSRGVLHRDIKPANVMVGRHGETLVVDWGLAKILGDAAGSSAQLATSSPDGSGLGSATLDGAGTPGYMAPEQAAGEVEKLGPAADVYALGATLYHLLVGEGPLNQQSTVAAVSLTLMGQVPSARSLNPRVPKPLDALCRKAMAAEPRHRYASAEALAADCERWLADEPVSCLREGSVTTAKRWMRRHPTTLATSLAAVLLLGVGAVGFAGLVSSQRSELAIKNADIAAERDRANQERDRAVAAEKTAGIERDRAVEAEQLAAANFAEARKVLAACLDLARENPVFQRPGMQEPRELLLRAAAPFHDRFAAIGGTRELRAEAVLAKFEAALQAYQTKSRPEAIALFERCVAELGALSAEHPDEPKFAINLASSHQNLGVLLWESGNRAGATRRWQQSLTLLEEQVRRHPDRHEYRTRLAASHANLATVLCEAGDLRGGLDHHRTALRMRTELATEHPDVGVYRAELAASYNNIAALFMDIGKPAEAESQFREALRLQVELVAQDPTVLKYRSDLASYHNNLGQLISLEKPRRAEAQKQYAEALGHLRRLVEENPAVVAYRAALASTRYNIGLLAAGSGDAVVAEREMRAALADRKTLAEQNPERIRLRYNLGLSHHNLGELLRTGSGRAEAESHARSAVAELSHVVREGGRTPEFQRALALAQLLLAILLAEREPSEAVALLRQVGPGASDAVRRGRDFESLRQRADVQALLAEWDAGRAAPDKP